MEGQMSIFDFIKQPATSFTSNDIINNLICDVKEKYPDKVRNVEYTIWDHCPNYGKRLFLIVDNVCDEYDLESLIEKYKKHHLKISVSPVPRFNHGEKKQNGINLYISTMWITKGYKEKS